MFAVFLSSPPHHFYVDPFKGSPPFLRHVFVQWGLREVGSQKGFLSLVVSLHNGTLLVLQCLSGLVDSGRYVLRRCPDIISLTFLQEPVPVLSLSPPDAPPEVVTRLFEAADACWAVPKFSPGFSQLAP